MFGKRNSSIFLSLAAIFVLSGCGDNNTAKTQTYKVTLKNITNAQPFAPAALIVQNSTTSFDSFKVGQSASVGLETLSESGNPQVLLDEATDANVLYTNKFDGLTTPGESQSLTFTVDNGSLKLSLVSMPVKTNDGFVGVNNINLNFEGTKSFNLNVYDAGTEKNDELSSTVAGLGGIGFDSTRDDIADIVTLHPGLVTKDDGLSTSGLSFSDKWDNPAATLTIQRIN
jgi:hypothetical protein